MTVVLPSSIRNKKNKKRTIAPVKPSRGEEIDYFSQLDQLNKDLEDSAKDIELMMNNNADAQIIASELREKQRAQTQRYLAISAAVASAFVLRIDRRNKRKVESSIAKPLRIKKEQVNILDDEQIEKARQAAIIENTRLIRSIPEKYFSDVANAITNNFLGLNQVGDVTLSQRLQDIGGISKNRARFIARDQTAKVTSSLTRARHQAAGINTYKWRNSQDRRVVGNPSGLYPKPTRGHGDHWVREGKVFSYDRPPSDGNPGMAFNCRCTAEPVLDLDSDKIVVA